MTQETLASSATRDGAWYHMLYHLHAGKPSALISRQQRHACLLPRPLQLGGTHTPAHLTLQELPRDAKGTRTAVVV